MSSDERTFGPVPTCDRGPEVPDRQRHRAALEKVRGPGPHTDGAVLAVPALAAFTLAVPAGAVLGAARVAGSLTARWARPAFFTAASAPHADAVQAAVRGTDLWGEKERKPGRRGEQRRVRRGAREKRFVSNSARQQGEEQSR